MPVPDHIDMYLVSREMAASEKSALKAVIDVDKERILVIFLVIAFIGIN